jgi:hypothetical protein
MNNAPLPTPAQIQALVNSGQVSPAQQAAWLQQMGGASASPGGYDPLTGGSGQPDPALQALQARRAAQAAQPAPANNTADRLAAAGLPPQAPFNPAATGAAGAADAAAGDPALAAMLAKRGAPGGTAAPATPRNLTPPPAGAGAAPSAGGSPVDDALAKFVSGGGSVPHAAGMSPASREYAKSLGEEGQEQADVTSQALGHLQTLADSASEQSRALGEDAAIAHQQFVQQKQRDDEHRARLVDETKTRQSKLDEALAQAGAQGVDPNRYYQNMSTPQKIGAAVAIGLGAFSAHALGPNGQGGQNYAGKIIEDAITADIDAQRSNMAAKLDVLGKRMTANAQGFDQQSAMLAAERDSTMSAYTVASNDIARRAATFQGNADAQTKLEAMRQELIGRRDEKVAALNDRLFAIYKAAEAPVGGGNTVTPKMVTERAQAIADKAREAGHEITPEASREQAAREYGLVKGGSNPELAKPTKDGGQPGQLASVRSALDGVNKLIALRQNAGFIRSPDQKAEAAAIAEATRTNFAKAMGARLSPELLKQYQSLIPGDPLEHNVSGLVGQDPTGARLNATKRTLEIQLQQLQAGGGGAASAPDDALERDEVQ